MKNLFLFLFLLILSIPSYGLHRPFAHRVTINWKYVHTEPFITGFKVYCGQDSGVLTFILNITNRSQRHQHIYDLQLSDGINYCALTTYNLDGESEYSNEVSMLIKDWELVTYTPGIPQNFYLK